MLAHLKTGPEWGGGPGRKWDFDQFKELKSLAFVSYHQFLIWSLSVQGRRSKLVNFWAEWKPEKVGVENSCFPSFHLGRSGGEGALWPDSAFLPQKNQGLVTALEWEGELEVNNVLILDNILNCHLYLYWLGELCICQVFTLVSCGTNCGWESDT